MRDLLPAGDRGEPLRVLLVNTLFPPIVKGGAEVSTAKLAAALAARGHDAHVLTIAPEPQETRVENGVTVHRLAPALVRYPYTERPRGRLSKLALHALDNDNPAMFARTREVIRQVRPDIVHTNVLQLISGAVWRAARAEGVPVLHNLRDYWLLCTRSGFFRDGRACDRKCTDCRLFTALRRKRSELVDGVVAVGQTVLDIHRQAGLFSGAKVAEAILSATDPVEPTPRRPVGEGTTLRLGYIGRIKEAKGVRTLLEAMRLVPAAANVELVVAGSGTRDDMAGLRDLADARTKFLGWCDPAELYGRVDAVVVPSLYPEPLPRAVLEAYRYGLPVLAAASGGTPEVVEHGRSGWLYPPGDAGRLAALIAGLRGPDGLGAASPESIAGFVARSEPAFVVREYERVYRRLLA